MEVFFLLLPLAALALGWLLVTIGFARIHQVFVVDSKIFKE
jgi:hypothetical protein